jgi:ABC-2 type transport system ATP-binding protein
VTLPSAEAAARAAAPYRSPAAGEAPVDAAAPVIECDGIVHSFGTKPVLRGVSFRVPRGSIYGFIGPNGAGKTTTLRVLATLLTPARGTARVAGHDVITHADDVRRVLGYMPDGHGVSEHLNVAEYLHFFASAHGIHGQDRWRAVGRAIELTGIGALRPTQVTTLSKGQKQRLLLARTLLHDPEVLVLDEPASDLDPRARVELRSLLGVLRQMGKTILLSSHILSELAGLCDSIGVIENGRILASGPLAEVRSAVRPGQRLRLTVLGRSDEAIGALRGCTGVSSVAALEPAGADAGRPETSVLEVAYEGDERVVAALVAALVKAGAGVISVEPERHDLERVFMDLTGERAGTGQESKGVVR